MKIFNWRIVGRSENLFINEGSEFKNFIIVLFLFYFEYKFIISFWCMEICCGFIVFCLGVKIYYIWNCCVFGDK